MDKNAVGQSREARRDFHPSSYDARFRTRRHKFLDVLANQRPHWRDGTCESQTEAVKNGFPSQRQHVFRNVTIFRTRDELRNIPEDVLALGRKSILDGFGL